jgi:hypothetical protein
VSRLAQSHVSTADSVTDASYPCQNDCHASEEILGKGEASGELAFARGGTAWSHPPSSELAPPTPAAQPSTLDDTRPTSPQDWILEKLQVFLVALTVAVISRALVQTFFLLFLGCQ